MLCRTILQKYPGFKPLKLYDPMIGCWMISPDEGANLEWKLICEQLLLTEKNQHSLFSSVAVSQLFADVAFCVRIWRACERKLRECELWNAFETQEMPLVNILAGLFVFFFFWYLCLFCIYVCFFFRKRNGIGWNLF